MFPPLIEERHAAPYDPARLVAKRQALAGQQLQNDTATQDLALGGQKLQAAQYANQQTAMDLADNARLRAVLGSMSSGTASAPAATAAPLSTPVAPSPGAQYPKLPSGLIDRTGSPVTAAPAATPAAAVATGAPAAAPEFDWDSVTNQLRGQVQPKTLFGLQQMVLANREKVATLAKTRGEVDEAHQKLQTAENDLFAGQAAKIQELGYDPSAITVALHQLASLGPTYAQHAAQIQQAIAQNPDNAKLIIDAVRAGASAPMETAQARALTASTSAGKQALEAPTQRANAEQAQRLQAVQRLLTAQDPESYTDILNELPHGIARLMPAFDAANPAGTLAQLRRIGMSPEQQVQADQAAENGRRTGANEAEMRQQGRQRLGIESAGLAIRRAEADPYGTLGVNPHPITPPMADGQTLTGPAYLQAIAAKNPGMAATVKAIAEGRQTHFPRGKELGPLMAAVNQYDPTFNETRGKMRAAFTAGKQGQNVQALNTATVHLDQLADAADALKNHSFRPGNAAYNSLAAAFGDSAVTNFDALKTAVAGEMATALKGNATDQEIRHLTETLVSSNSPAQLAGVARTHLHVLGAKLNTYDEQYHATVGKDDPWSPVLPTAQAVFAKNGIRPLAAAAAPKKNPYR